MGRRCWFPCAAPLAHGRAGTRAGFVFHSHLSSTSSHLPWSHSDFMIQTPSAPQIKSEPVYTDHGCLSMPPAHPSPGSDQHSPIPVVPRLALPAVPHGRVFLQGGTERGNLLCQALQDRVLHLGLVGAVKALEGVGRIQRINLGEQREGGQKRAALPQMGLQTRFIPRCTQPSLGSSSWSSVMLRASLRISSSWDPSSSSMVGSLSLCPSQLSRGGRRPLPSAVICSQAGKQRPGDKLCPQ